MNRNDPFFNQSDHIDIDAINMLAAQDEVPIHIKTDRSLTRSMWKYFSKDESGTQVKCSI